LHCVKEIKYCLPSKGETNWGPPMPRDYYFIQKILQVICPKSLSWVTAYISLGCMINSKKVQQCQNIFVQKIFP